MLSNERKLTTTEKSTDL